MTAQRGCGMLRREKNCTDSPVTRANARVSPCRLMASVLSPAARIRRSVCGSLDRVIDEGLLRQSRDTNSSFCDYTIVFSGEPVVVKRNLWRLIVGVSLLTIIANLS